jgi:hypothetical protein
MTAANTNHPAVRRRRHLRRLLLLTDSSFLAPPDTPADRVPGDSILRASAALSEMELLSSLRQGRQRLDAVSDFEHRHGTG